MARYENPLIVELDIAAWEEFKLIEHGVARLWEQTSGEPGEVVPDSMEKDDVVSGDSSDQADFARQNAFILSYDLNKTPEENEGSYGRMSPEKRNE
ncbi:hypothetical protein Ahy_B03g064282 [Arachis hypogaea]|uniref:Uncharacterized protein n=1 Tax=Arachis hypogaea TaxID=3818 RepID=A0A444ZZA2_ARAHY|nr:hypothetical protein Ahy_B03g064282 [Arachis hypogaea]